MATLFQTLRLHDIGFLRIIARLWGIELVATQADMAARELAERMLEIGSFNETAAALPAEVRSALQEIASLGGKITWASFSRQHGEIRPAGAGKRDREEIFLHPISTSEILFYRGLIDRAFHDLPDGVQEMATIPEDLIPLVNTLQLTAGPGSTNKFANSYQAREKRQAVTIDSTPLGRPASRKEYTHTLPIFDRLLDDATTYLAAIRKGIPSPPLAVPSQVLREFLIAAGIIADGEPHLEAVQKFLEANRSQALNLLRQGWLQSEIFNERNQVPGLVFEGESSNQPLSTRTFLLALVNAILENQWWSIAAFIRSIKEKHPDFQRPVGDYDSWFIRTAEGKYLRGFEYWDQVDGALVHYLITGPLTWMGMVQLAAEEQGQPATAFRKLLVVKGRFSAGNSATKRVAVNLRVTSQGRIFIPRAFSRVSRYQISRFCDWQGEKNDEYEYRVTTASLKAAKEQGLKAHQLLQLLAKGAAVEIPPTLVKALDRWEKAGTEARLESHTVLKMNNPDEMEKLQKTSASRFLGERLGPVTVVVKPGAVQKVLNALAEMGILAEVESSNEHPI